MTAAYRCHTIREPGCQMSPYSPPGMLHELMAVVAAETRIRLTDMVSLRRNKAAVRSRMIYYWLARHVTEKSMTQIGKVCGGRNHCTIINGINRVEQNRAYFEPELSRLYQRYQRYPQTDLAA